LDEYESLVFLGAAQFPLAPSLPLRRAQVNIYSHAPLCPSWIRSKRQGDEQACARFGAIVFELLRRA